MNKIKLWTIQSAEVYDQLQKNGYYIPNEKHIILLDEEEFKKAYNWMTRQMNKFEIKNIYGNKYPIFAWYKFDGHLAVGKYFEELKEMIETNGVFMELEIEADRVLLSDFDKWHYVLNDFIPEFEYWKNKDETLDEFQKKILHETYWDDIFNIKNSEYIQATFFYLLKNDIKSVKPIYFK